MKPGACWLRLEQLMAIVESFLCLNKIDFFLLDNIIKLHASFFRPLSTHRVTVSMEHTMVHP